jgi:hypothetical protein
VEVAVGVGVEVAVGLAVEVAVGVGVEVAVGVAVDVGDGVGVGVGAEAELSTLGVPLTGLPSASNPLRVRPSLVPQLTSASAAVGSRRSMLAQDGLPAPAVPPGQPPPSALAVSITFKLSSLRVRDSPALPSAPM